MDNEKYGIELDLVLNKFRQKIQEAKSTFNSITDKKINLNANTAQINYLKSQINDLTEKIRRIGKGFETGDVLKYEAQLERVKNQYNTLIAKQNQLSTASTKTGTNIVKGLDRMTSKIKRFGLSLLSIRSMYLLVSRASSAYLAQDTALANRLQSAWAGLGALLAPIIETMVNLIAKAVKYINIFIKALTGVDLLAKASAKSIGGTAKAAKALNKALAGFDELQNLDTEAGGGDGLASSLGGLADVKIDTKWADRIRAFGEWLRKNKNSMLSVFTGLATTIGLIKAGVKGIKALGIGAIISGATYAIQSLIKYIKDPSWDNFGKIIQGIGIAVIGLGIAFLGLPGIITGVVILIVGTIVKYWEQIKAFFQKGVDWLVSKSDFVHQRFGLLIGTIYDMFVGNITQVINFFDGFFRMVKGVLDGIIMIVKGVFTRDWEMAWQGVKNVLVSILAGISRMFESTIGMIKNMVVNVGKAAGNLISSTFKAVVNSVMRTIENVLNAPIKAINKMIGAINAIPGVNLSKLNTFSLPRLATGTNYVPEDQIAMIHKGEAVVPKKFNSKEYFGSGNEETNSRLEELIEAVRNIEINPYTTIRDVGKASLSYINGKSRQLGESVVI